MNLEVRLYDPAVFEFSSELDAWAVKYPELHAQRLFKRTMSAAQVAAGCHTVVGQREGYDSLLHTKVSTEGHSLIRH